LRRFREPRSPIHPRPPQSVEIQVVRAQWRTTGERITHESTRFEVQTLRRRFVRACRGCGRGWSR
jgi:hypothetical protein